MGLLGLSVHSGLNYDLGYTNESPPVGEASEYAIERRIYYRAFKHNTKKKRTRYARQHKEQRMGCCGQKKKEEEEV